MNIEAAVACVGYDDFLKITLPLVVRSVDRVTVITAPWDTETSAVAKQFGASLLVTAAWRENGSFNKARALNAWIDDIAQVDESVWLMTLDADVLLPESCAVRNDALEPNCLYSARRRMCTYEADWQDYRAQKRGLESFPLDVQPIIGGKLWGTLETRNDAGLLGYFQMWNPHRAEGWTRFREAPTASGYDVLFGLSFHEKARKYLHGYEVLHLGPTRVNWAGRRSARWGNQNMGETRGSMGSDGE